MKGIAGFILAVVVCGVSWGADCPTCRRAPQTIVIPRVVPQAYQYQRSTYQPRYYGTPVRNWIWGRGVVTHWYAPANVANWQQTQRGGRR